MVVFLLLILFLTPGILPVQDLPPTVLITHPVEGSIICGWSDVALTLSDDKGISRVEYYINDKLVGKEYGFKWDTTQYRDGKCQLRARVVDNQGQKAEDTILVEVQNGKEFLNPVREKQGRDSETSQLLLVKDNIGVLYQLHNRKETELIRGVKQILSGHLDSDSTPDWVFLKDKESGIWIITTQEGQSKKISNCPHVKQILWGDMNGDGMKDMVTSHSHGIYFRDTVSGNWFCIATYASSMATGDFDGDGVDDLLGVWDTGVWMKLSRNCCWVKLMANQRVRGVASGDLNGDGVSDFLVNMEEGVYYCNTRTWEWHKWVGTAEAMGAADLDGDGADDLIWVDKYRGTYVRYTSKQPIVERLTDAVEKISLLQPNTPAQPLKPELSSFLTKESAYAPGGVAFQYRSYENPAPGSVIDSQFQSNIPPGPGTSDFNPQYEK